MSREPLIFIVTLLLLGSVTPAGASTPHDAQPDSVVALQLVNLVAMVAWNVGDAPADYYNVYGQTGGGLEMIASTTSLAMIVDGGYSTYGVSAVVDGLESSVMLALPLPCAKVDHHEVPPVAIEAECGWGGVDGSVMVLPP